VPLGGQAGFCLQALWDLRLGIVVQLAACVRAGQVMQVRLPSSLTPTASVEVI
jgi:hypothetical protein